MRFRIEFLREPTEEHSVCHSRAVRARDLKLAQLQAYAWSQGAKQRFGAGGFQIRWLDGDGRIVMIEAFEGPPPSVH